MKKNTLALSTLSLVFFIACSNNEPSEKIVQKYEDVLNTGLKQKIFNTNKVDINFSPFICKADEGYILCDSQGLSLRNKESNQEILNIAKLELRTNEYYSGDAAGLISFKDYYDDILKKNKKIESTLLIKGFKLGEMVKADVQNRIHLINDANIKQFFNKFTDDEYNFEIYDTFEKESDELESQGYFSFNNARNTLNFKLNIDPIRYNSNFFQAFDSRNLKFDTNTSSIDGKAIEKLLNSENDYNTSDEFEDFALDLMKGIKLSGFNLDFSLDTENLFEGYVNEAKDALQTNNNPKLASLTQKALTTLNDIIKNPVYKINLAVKLKSDTILTDYSKIGLDGIEKITLNGQDFTTEFKERVPMIVFMLLATGSY